MSSKPQRTIKHDVIKGWAEKRGGVPARVRTTSDALKIKIGDDEPSYETIEWKEWFEVFDEKEYAMLFEDPGYLCKIVKRNGKEDAAPKEPAKG